MYIIAVSDKAFCGGRELATVLAKKLGLLYVDSTTLVERATASGGDRKKLAAAFEDAPACPRLFTRHRQNQILQLQAALAEAIRDGGAVCYGIAADLQSLEARQVLRIGIQASHRFRRHQLQEQLNVRGAKAERYLQICDQNRRRRFLYLFETKIGPPRGDDLLVDLEETSVDAACMTVYETICDQVRFSTGDISSLESFALSTSVMAELARHPDTAHLDLDVEIRGNSAILRGDVEDANEMDSIQRVAGCCRWVRQKVFRNCIPSRSSGEQK